MPSKKILILSVVVSLLAHALLISATGLLEIRLGKTDRERIINVSLPELQEARSEPVREMPAEEAPASPPEAIVITDDPGQDIINLDSEDEEFAPYLKKIKRKIEDIWSYPPEALAKRLEGVSTVVFSVNNRGKLVGSKILESSGSAALDQGTIDVIRTAAPYEPFPPQINLARLRIQATFRYRFLR